MNRVDIRLESIKIALQIHSIDINNVVDIAKIIEDYIAGDADIPEYIDPNAALMRMVDSMESMKNQNNIEESLNKKYGFGICMEKQIRENDN